MSNKQTMLDRALFLKRTLGTRCAAGFMRNNGMSLDAALWHLLGTTRRSFSRL